MLSPKDLCSLDYIPSLVNLGINSFKIEGRMKTPEYVATVTKIYRKYINLALSKENYEISNLDKKELLQVFNRGGFSNGYLSDEPNRNLVYSAKSNNMGLYLGNISNYNSNKGYITINLNEDISIGDGISIDGETGKYTVSEIIKSNTNFKSAQIGETVKLGRMKGKIKLGAKVYKLSSKQLIDTVNKTISTENKKIPLSCYLTVKKGAPIKIILEADVAPFYNKISVEYISDIVPEASINSPITVEKLESQLSKLGNTPYSFSEVNIDLDENLHIPSISAINNLRRVSISMLEDKVVRRFLQNRTSSEFSLAMPSATCKKYAERKISLLIENMNKNYNYKDIDGIDNVYVPLKFLMNKNLNTQLLALSQKFNLYIYMPNILKSNFKNILLNNLNTLLSKYSVKGFVISNIADFELLRNYINDENYKFVANYTMNIFNVQTIKNLADMGIDVATPSIELSKSILKKMVANASLPLELVAYNRAILMTSSYCLLGKSNKCYPECNMYCSNNSSLYLQDRLGFKFKVVPDNLQTITTIYNSKITSIDTTDLDVYSLRIDMLDETIEEINKIIKIVKTGKKIEGKEYTNGNLNREV